MDFGLVGVDLFFRVHFFPTPNGETGSFECFEMWEEKLFSIFSLMFLDQHDTSCYKIESIE